MSLRFSGGSPSRSRAPRRVARSGLGRRSHPSGPRSGPVASQRYSRRRRRGTLAGRRSPDPSLLRGGSPPRRHEPDRDLTVPTAALGREHEFVRSRRGRGDEDVQAPPDVLAVQPPIAAFRRDRPRIAACRGAPQPQRLALDIGVPVARVQDGDVGRARGNRLSAMTSSAESGDRTAVEPEERSIVELEQAIAQWSHGADSRSPTAGAQSNRRPLLMR